jgi:hypothetical protein
MRAAVEREALIVGMTLVPNLLSRNRSFDLFEHPEARSARRRAAALRGLVRQLVGGQGRVESLRVARAAGFHELTYCVPGLKMQRRASLTDVELACVRCLAGRAGVAGLCPSEADRAGVDAALRRLAAGLKLPGMDSGITNG